jgi:hypothetical protein
MSSLACERAIAEALRVGNAILKFISPNDVGLTGGHQWGYYLPKSLWKTFSPHAPKKGINADSPVQVIWNDDIVTNSRVTWYGKAKSEYRLTRFGRGFPFITPVNVGNLLVLIPESHSNFRCYVLDNEADIEEIQSALGVEIIERWAAFINGVPQEETEDECIERRFQDFAQQLKDFPSGQAFSDHTWSVLRECITDLEKLTTDALLMQGMDAEYRLFRLAERRICQPEISRDFRDVDDFIDAAAAILNRRKSRAGRSLENHVAFLLARAGIPHTMRPNVDGKPEILIPGRKEYLDPKFPTEKLVVVGVKRTCKDRWRQVLNEGKRVSEKHILTIQQGISENQMKEMEEAKVTLIVPADLHAFYPPKARPKLVKLEQFIDSVRTRLI